jgi:PAS domain-containing protein/anti-sigma regulatory factor (Ser/Thr protein kinase)
MGAEAERGNLPPGEAELWARAVLDQTRLLVAMIDTDGVLLSASTALLSAIGAERSRIIGRPLESARRWVQAPEARTRLREAIADVSRGRSMVYEIRGPQPGCDGPQVIVDVSMIPIMDGGGAATRIRIEGRDVTGHRAAEALALASAEAARAGRAAAEKSAQVQLALEAAGMALWTWDLVTDTVTWSGRSDQVGAPLPNDSPDELVGRWVHPQDRARMQRAVDAVRAGSAALDQEFRVVHRDGRVNWLLARGYVHRDTQGAPASIAGIVLDITERATARVEHARLLQAERQAGRRASALQRVTAALSEAATCEQVAAVMAEESLRSLGVDAARVDLVAGQPIGGPVPTKDGRVMRAAGLAHLLDGIPAEAQPGGDGVDVQSRPDRTRIALTLTSRGRRRGRWQIAWLTADGADRPADRPADGAPDGDVDQAEPSDPPEAFVPSQSPDGYGRPSQQRWSRPDWTGPDGLALLRTLATECAQALDRAQLYEQQRDIATVLQRTLLPARLPPVTGALVAARYQPGGQGVDVGGDWYDVITLPDGRTGLVIGDVEGHSAVAAAVMGQVRNALRAYAVEGSTPAIVMERLNRLLARLQVMQLVTCCYLEFSPTEGTATVVLAGHPPPLVVRSDGSSEYVPAHPNLLLGVDESATYHETTVLLDPGACLLLYTDGLVESVSRSLPAGLEALRGWARDWPPEESPDELVEMLIRRAREGPPVLDDVAVLALRYIPVRRTLGRTRSVRRRFPLDPASASAARRFVTDVLSQWGHQSLSYQVTLMASELVTNSVLHTSGELELGLILDDDRVRVEVVDRSERLPTLQQPDDEAPGGRGLLIISALAHRWGVDGRGDGKAVWFEVMLDTAPSIS